MKAATLPQIANSLYTKLWSDKLALVSFVTLVLLTAVAILAPFLAPQDPYNLVELDILDADLPPFWQEDSDNRFLLGTDSQGRDMLSAMLYGARLSLIIGVLATALQLVLGVSIGLIAGYRGGAVDAFFMRLADIQLSLSTLMLAIIALALFQTAFGSENFGNYAVVLLVLIIGIAEWPQFARTTRASVLAEKQKDYVLAAHALGSTTIRILKHHILPNIMSPILIIATVQIANAIMTEAALSFLNLGMPVTQPSLGTLIRSGFADLFSGSWWITTLPSIVLITIILTINLLGDFLRDAFNPTLSTFR